MIEKLKPGSRAFILVLGAIILSVIMAMSSYFTPDIAPSYEMVTAAPQSGVGGYKEELPNCIRCGGTDCVIWLPTGAEVSKEVVKGTYGNVSWIVLTTENASIDDSIRNSILKETIANVPGTSKNVHLLCMEEGYAGRERAIYEEMHVREKVSLHTRNGYFFTYLIHTMNGTGVVVSTSCDGSKNVSEARELARSIAYSLQRNDEQEEEVKMAIFREAKTGSVTGDLSEEETDMFYNFSNENLQPPSAYEENLSEAGNFSEAGNLPEAGNFPEARNFSETGSLEINSGFSLLREVKCGEAIVISWENTRAVPTRLMIISPSEEILYPDEELGLTGTYVFWATKDEPSQGWILVGETERMLGNTYPSVKTQEELVSQYWE